MSAERPLEPGQDCPTCKRRVPHPKKPNSPKTKVFAVRVPTDDADSFRDIIDAAGAHIAATGRPHSTYWVLHYALVALLQCEDFRDALART